MFLSVFLLCASLAVSQSPPNLIPAVQQWNQTAGTFVLSSSCVILVQNSSILAVATTFQRDLGLLTKMNCSLRTSTPSSFVMLLGGPNSILGQEGYTLDIQSHQIVISANTPGGIFYGTQTLLQLFRLYGLSIPSAEILDFPKYPFRAVMFDCGRLFFSYEWLVSMVPEMAYLKLNTMHLHVAEWNNFRLESESHPEIVAEEHYTKAQLRQLMTLAEEYFVQLIIEIETPGHSSYILDVHPNLGALQANGERDPANLDLTSSDVYVFVEQLFQEFLPFFNTSAYFHIGSDEYIQPSDYVNYPEFLPYAQQQWGPNATGQDVYIHYVNWVANLTINSGKKVLAWNDNKSPGNIFSIDERIVLDGWGWVAQNQWASGFNVINSFQTMLFPALYEAYPEETSLYETWSANFWSPAGPSSVPAFDPRFYGSKLQFWMDYDLFEIYSAEYFMFNYIRTIAQKTWDSPLLTPTYTVFKQMAWQLGHAPNTNWPTTLPPYVPAYGPYFTQPNVLIQFTNAGIYARNGTIASYYWDFGDEITSHLAIPTHSYANVGSYTVTLLVTDSNSMNAANRSSVTVQKNVSSTAVPATKETTRIPTLSTIPPLADSSSCVTDYPYSYFDFKFPNYKCDSSCNNYTHIFKYEYINYPFSPHAIPWTNSTILGNSDWTLQHWNSLGDDRGPNQL